MVIVFKCKGSTVFISSLSERGPYQRFEKESQICQQLNQSLSSLPLFPNYIHKYCKQTPVELTGAQPLRVVRGRPPAQRMPGERDGYLCSKLLQLQAAGGWETTPRQLSGLQAREGGTAEEENTENTQYNNRESVLFQLNHARCLLHGSAPRKYSAAATAGSSGTPTSCGRSSHWNAVP
jgi:hypothetical protein